MTNDLCEAQAPAQKKVKISGKLIEPIEVDVYHDAIREIALNSLPPEDATDRAVTNLMGLIVSGAIQTWGIFEEGTRRLLGALFSWKSRDKITGRTSLILYGLHMRGAETIDDLTLFAAWRAVEVWAKREGCSRIIFECNRKDHFALAEKLDFRFTHRAMVKEI